LGLIAGVVPPKSRAGVWQWRAPADTRREDITTGGLQRLQRLGPARQGAGAGERVGRSRWEDRFGAASLLNLVLLSCRRRETALTYGVNRRLVPPLSGRNGAPKPFDKQPWRY